MTCSECGNEMRIKATYRGIKWWHRIYVCDFCRNKFKKKFKNPKGN